MLDWEKFYKYHHTQGYIVLELYAYVCLCVSMYTYTHISENSSEVPSKTPSEPFASNFAMYLVIIALFLIAGLGWYLKIHILQTGKVGGPNNGSFYYCKDFILLKNF